MLKHILNSYSKAIASAQIIEAYHNNLLLDAKNVTDLTEIKQSNLIRGSTLARLQDVMFPEDCKLMREEAGKITCADIYSWKESV